MVTPRNSVCLRKEVGGLEVRRISEFNSALLGKWCWRLLVEKESLWYRVLSSRYGEEGGNLLDSERCASAWWRAIAALRRESWFSNNVCRLMGDGKNTNFWEDVWIGGVSLKESFSRLFELSVEKGVSVFDMFHLGWGENSEAWKWRRRLFVWEEEKTTQQIVDTPVDVKSLWQKDIPLKVVIFAWRLFRNRLPTKDNLLRRGILNNNDTCLCVAGCDSLETANHLFLHCPLSGSVWNLILRWVGLSTTAPFSPSDHFTQFILGGGGPHM
ncbi:uncharacterized protein [Medicago truncatula]|uniref:uncharacterized protein n=1 Tax=Medicago truncatula TaxID=3880 RepID=UPI000D2F3335|nr:uncharacterized protein LOC112420743 [Medicago truncatula]